MAPLGIKIDGFPNAISRYKTPFFACFKLKRVNVTPIFPKLIGSGTLCSKIDGFPGTHGTHANGATGGETIQGRKQLNESKLFKEIRYIFVVELVFSKMFDLF